MSLTKISYSMITGAEFNVLDFGADPTGSADSTAAFKAAIGAYNDTRSIYVPAGQYKITDQLWLGISKTIYGDGRGATFLNYNSNITNGGVFLTDAFCFIRDLAIINQGTNTTTSIALCSWAQGGTNGSIECEFKNLKISGFGYGVTSSTLPVNVPMTATLTNAQVYDSVYNNIYFNNCNIPVYLGGSGINGTTFRQCFFLGSTGSRHVIINGAVGCSLLECAFQSSTVALDCEFNGSVNISLKDGYFEPANGIFADFCPGLVIDSCVLVAENFTGISNYSFLRQTSASTPSGWTLPYYSTLSNCVLLSNATTSSPSWSVNDTPYNFITNTMNLYSKNNDMAFGASNNYIDVVRTLSNGYGTYRYHSDGTLVCTSVVTGSGLTSTGIVNLTVPFAANYYISAPAVSYSVIEPTTNTGRYTINYVTTTNSTAQITFQFNVTTAFTTAPNISVTAIGSWK